MLLTRMNGYGFGALPPMTVSQSAIDRVVQIKSAPATRQSMYDERHRWNVSLSRESWFVRQNIQTVQCVGDTSVLDPSIAKDCGKDISPERILMPLGVINVLMVPIPANELIETGEDGVLTRTYSPSYYQASDASYRAYVTSQNVLLDAVNERLRRFGPTGPMSAPQVKAPDGPFELWCAGIDEKGAPLDPTKSILSLAGYVNVLDKLQHKSNPGALQHLLDLGAGFVTAVDGFYNNPIQPTQDELTKEGGTLAYYQRGGFVLAKTVMNGTTPLQQAELKVNVSYFMCADGKLGVSTEKIPDEGNGWLYYVAFGSDSPTSPVDSSWINHPPFAETWGTYKLRAQMKDRSTWQSVKHGVAEFVKKVAEYVCMAAPLASSVAQQINQTCKRTAPENASQADKEAAGCVSMEATAEKGTPLWTQCQAKLARCKSGDPGCTCAPAATANPYSMAAQAGGKFLTTVCQGKADAPIKCEQFVPPPKTFPAWALLLLASAAAIGGAAYAAKRRRPALASKHL